MDYFLNIYKEQLKKYFNQDVDEKTKGEIDQEIKIYFKEENLIKLDKQSLSDIWNHQYTFLKSLMEKYVSEGRSLTDKTFSKIIGFDTVVQLNYIKKNNLDRGKPEFVRAVIDTQNYIWRLDQRLAVSSSFEEKLEISKSRKWVFRAILLSVLSLFIILAQYFLLSNRFNNRVLLEKEMCYEKTEDVKLWMAFQPRDTQLQPRFDSLIKPIYELLEEDRFDVLLLALQADPKIDSPFEPEYLNNFIKRALTPDSSGVITYGEGEEFLYDFNTGVVSFSPSIPNIIRDRNEINELTGKFQQINKVILKSIAGQYSQISSLEGGLSRILGYNSESIIKPVLIYSFFFEDSDSLESCFMYRFPAYKGIDNKSITFLDYDHNKRPFFLSFLKTRINGDEFANTAYKIDNYKQVEDGKTVAWLSPIYSDYKRKTIVPIRTLIIEQQMANGSLRLLCIDFKL